MGLGDTLEAALSAVGITSARVQRWLGNCCCQERRERLNALGWWAARVVSGKVEGMAEHLRRMLD